mmetsp:Transcript_55726/g.132856  ORF Transcript_55726/g.132856 Transcript_55726/m.132856 type:complete len:231 (+) Transcript_55726:212-904(+)
MSQAHLIRSSLTTKPATHASSTFISSSHKYKRMTQKTTTSLVVHKECIHILRLEVCLRGVTRRIMTSHNSVWIGSSLTTRLTSSRSRRRWRRRSLGDNIVVPIATRKSVHTIRVRTSPTSRRNTSTNSILVPCTQCTDQSRLTARKDRNHLAILMHLSPNLKHSVHDRRQGSPELSWIHNVGWHRRSTLGKSACHVSTVLTSSGAIALLSHEMQRRNATRGKNITTREGV